jgi:hypothetical protein
MKWEKTKWKGKALGARGCTIRTCGRKEGWHRGREGGRMEGQATMSMCLIKHLAMNTCGGETVLISAPDGHEWLA